MIGKLRNKNETGLMIPYMARIVILLKFCGRGINMFICRKDRAYRLKTKPYKRKEIKKCQFGANTPLRLTAILGTGPSFGVYKQSLLYGHNKESHEVSSPTAKTMQ